MGNKRFCSIRIGGNIGVTGSGHNVGTSLFSVMLAGFLSESGFDISYTECGTLLDKQRLLFHSYAMDQRFAGRGFVDIYGELAKGKGLYGLNNVENFGRKTDFGSIDWRLICPGDTCENRYNGSDNARLVSSARGDYNIFDIDSGGNFDDVLGDMDLVFIIVSPLPSRIIFEEERIRALKELSGQVRCIWVINQMNEGVSRREINRIFRCKDLIYIKALSSVGLYGCEFQCSYPWTIAEFKDEFWRIFAKFSNC